MSNLSVLAAIPSKPADREFFHDLAGVINADDAQTITNLQQKLFGQTGVPIVVVTIRGMADYDPQSPSIESFARRWFDTWGIGTQKKNDGMLIIVSTRRRGGVLIYLSLFERRLEVRCDRAVLEKIKQADLDAIRDAVLDRVRAGDATGGIIAGLDRAEEVLARAIPATGSTTDSLSNDLITFHPRP